MPEENNPEEPRTFSVEGLDDAAVLAAYETARSRGAELAAQEALSADESAEFATLAQTLDVAGARIDEINAAAAQADATREKFGSAPERSLPVTRQAPQKAVVEPTSVQTSQEAAPVPSVSQMAVQEPVVPARPASSITAFVSSDAAGHVGKAPGEAFDGLNEISRALIKSAQQFGKGGGKGRQLAIAQFQRQRDDRLVIGRNNDAEVINFARDERRLPGGSLAQAWQKSLDDGTSSLTAAAGWCAPSENDYDLCRQWSAGVGILDLPSVTATRGGVNYTDEIDFSTIYANAVAVGGGSNFLTEAQVIADTVKTCSEIPCPTFEDRRLDVLALCVRVSFLQAAGYPEVVNAWTDGLLAANEQEMNRLIIADILARAGAATVIPATVPDPDGGDSFTSALLAAIELAAEDTRYRLMMPWNSTVEIILPHWVLAQIRADLSRRNGVIMLAVTDGEIANMFSVRNVRVQFVRGWQDGLITGGALAPTFPGGDAATPFMTALPTTVDFLAYPAGSIVVARQDVVTLTNVYDAASLATNEFTSLFAEEGFAPLYPCSGQRLYTVTGCVAGVTGATSIDCADAV